MTRRIGVVTVGRSDYGIYYPLLRAIRDDVQCQLCLIAGGAHLSPVFGNPLSEIEGGWFRNWGSRADAHFLATHPSLYCRWVSGSSTLPTLIADILSLVLLGDWFENASPRQSPHYPYEFLSHTYTAASLHRRA